MPLDAALDHGEGALAELLLELVVVRELGAWLLGHLDHARQGRHLQQKSFHKSFNSFEKIKHFGKKEALRANGSPLALEFT